MSTAKMFYIAWLLGTAGMFVALHYICERLICTTVLLAVWSILYGSKLHELYRNNRM